MRTEQIASRQSWAAFSLPISDCRLWLIGIEKIGNRQSEIGNYDGLPDLHTAPASQPLFSAIVDWAGYI
jgi:hypothetical protein